jgi:DNA invertase Pin-like site-specific DNA recombinase
MKKGALLVGYARVSKADDQDTAAQVKALRQVGCKRIFEEKAAGGRWNRPQLHKALEQLREGDVLVVWKLDRLSRSLKDLLHIMERVRDVGAGFRSITEAVDTTTSAGRMVMQMLGSFAEFERSMVRERTRAGLAAARERGAKVGRPSKLSRRQQEEVVRTVRDGSKTAADAARLFGLHRSNITRLLARATEGAEGATPYFSSLPGSVGS